MEPCLAANRARLEAVFRTDAYLADLGAELVDWDGGRATFRLVPEARHCNFVGSILGGALFSLADAALGVACNSWGRLCVALTIEASAMTGIPLAGCDFAFLVPR